MAPPLNRAAENPSPDPRAAESPIQLLRALRKTGGCRRGMAMRRRPSRRCLSVSGQALPGLQPLKFPAFRRKSGGTDEPQDAAAMLHGSSEFAAQRLSLPVLKKRARHAPD